MVYIPFWICIFAGVAIDARERRFPNALAGACAVAAFAGVWLDEGVNTALDHAGLALIVCLALVLTELLWRRVRHAPGIGMGDAKALFALCTLDPLGGIVAFARRAPGAGPLLPLRKNAFSAIAPVSSADFCHNRGRGLHIVTDCAFFLRSMPWQLIKKRPSLRRAWTVFPRRCRPNLSSALPPIVLRAMSTRIVARRSGHFVVLIAPPTKARLCVRRLCAIPKRYFIFRRTPVMRAKRKSLVSVAMTICHAAVCTCSLSPRIARDIGRALGLKLRSDRGDWPGS